MKHKNKFGYIRKLPSGKYQASFLSPVDKKRINAPVTFFNKLLANDWLAEQHKKIELGIWVSENNKKNTNILFNDYAVDAINTRDIRDTTKQGYKFTFNNHIKNYFSGYKLVDIKRQDCILWYNSLNKNQNRMRASCLVLLKLIFNSAIKDELIEKSPAVTIHTNKNIPKNSTITDIRGSYVENSDITTLIEKSPVKWRLMIILGAYFGLRISEALALTIKDIDLKKNILRINKSVHYMAGKKGCYIDKPKSIKSIRDIPIPKQTIKYFTEHLELLNTTCKNRYLFTRPSDNNPVRDVYYRDKIFNKLKKYTVKKEFRYHDLRHTCLTNYARAGATVKDLMQIAGHSKPDVAMIYQETTFDRLDKLANLLL